MIAVCGSPPSVLPDISPSRGEIDSRLPPTPNLSVADEVGSMCLANLPPCGGDARQGRGG
jgi:hypothetical protein